MRIENIQIGESHDPVIIAEISGNHNQSLDTALALVEAAKNAGVHLLKLQTYKPDTITMDISKGEFVISDPTSLWFGRTLYSLYEEAHMPWEWQNEIMSLSKNLGMPCFSSVFDETSVEFLESLDVCAYKIASQEIVHLPLIKRVAETGKPIILSTGMASLSEIEEAVNMVRKTSSADFALLKCSSSYPAPPEFSNLSTIPMLRKLFSCEVGLSDHTHGIGVPLAAIALGATVVEKHITLDKRDGGVDSGFSSEPNEFKQLIEESVRVKAAIGNVGFGSTPADESSMSGRRSIYISEDVAENEVLTEKNIRVVRPNLGLPPKYISVVLGRRLNASAKKGTPLSWSLLL